MLVSVIFSSVSLVVLQKFGKARSTHDCSHIGANSVALANFSITVSVLISVTLFTEVSAADCILFLSVRHLVLNNAVGKNCKKPVHP